MRRTRRVKTEGFSFQRFRQKRKASVIAVGHAHVAVVELFVDDLEAESRRIIEFVGLGWDDACLRFHASGRIVRTASYEQVRQPIYRSSIGRYKRFERHLGPLLEALAADAG